MLASPIAATGYILEVIMKINLTETTVLLKPETPEEKYILHQIKYRGFREGLLLNLGTEDEQLCCNLGPDYLSESPK